MPLAAPPRTSLRNTPFAELAERAVPDAGGAKRRGRAAARVVTLRASFVVNLVLVCFLGIDVIVAVTEVQGVLHVLGGSATLGRCQCAG